MTTNYFTIKKFCFCLFFLSLGTGLAQLPKTFFSTDFQLNGPVKNCLVITDYGREQFEFDRQGRLVKQLTRFNDADYDVTYYKYQLDFILEKRDEVYRNNAFQRTTSIAHFFTLDTIANCVTERIISYDKQVLDQFEYFLDEQGALQRIIRTNNEGRDETEVARSIYKDEETQSYSLNGEMQKSVRTSVKKLGDRSTKIVLTKEYIKGTPNTAIEEQYNAAEQLISQISFRYDPGKKSFVKEEEQIFSYNEEGYLEEKVSSSFLPSPANKELPEPRKENFIYQYDGSDYKNWIKKIITPQNAYTTRKISYYKPLQEAVSTDSLNPEKQ